jgi:hypothetical protein
MLPRDRFGALKVDTSGEGPGDYQLPSVTAELVTQSLTTSPDFFINADGLGANARLELRLLDHQERPLRGYSATVNTSGFQVPVKWSATTAAMPDRVRVHAVFGGEKRTDIRLWAIYAR